jgi:signal peptidase I
MAFWSAIVLGLLALTADSVVVGAGLAGLFFAAAWGIRRGRRWAAVLAAYIMLMPFLAQAVRWDRQWDLMAVAVLVSVTGASLFLRAARRLDSATSPSGQAWPWIGAIAGLFAATLWLRPMMMPAGSMADTLRTGDFYFAETLTVGLGRTPQRGELIVFRYPADRRRIFTKRVVGIPGDRIRIADKRLYRNGVAVAEPYATHQTEYVDSFRDNFPSLPQFALAAQGTEMLSRNVEGGEVVVPRGHYFVLGDNRDNSLDSRYWGFVPQGDVLARPVIVYAGAHRPWPGWVAPHCLRAVR